MTTIDNPSCVFHANFESSITVGVDDALDDFGSNHCSTSLENQACTAVDFAISAGIEWHCLLDVDFNLVDSAVE